MSDKDEGHGGSAAAEEDQRKGEAAAASAPAQTKEDKELPEAKNDNKDDAKAAEDEGGDDEKEDRKKGDSEREERKKERRERKEEKRDRRDKSKSDRKDKDKDKDSERDRDRDRDRDRKKRSRSRSRDRRKDRRRDRDSRSRSRSRDRYRDRDRRRRSRSRSRDRRRRSRSFERRDNRRRDDRGDRRRGRSSSSDDYGGYVPRKRQEGMRSSRDGGPYSGSRRSPSFDKPLPAVVQRPSMQIPPVMDPAEALRKLQEQQLQARQLVLQQQAASAAAAATKTQREVYVGNLTVGLVTDEVLRTLFNNALQAAFPASATPGMEPVVNVNIHSDGRYCFVELRSPEMATEALKLSGLQLLGQALSVGRPSGYVDPAIAAQQAAQAAAALQAFQQAAHGVAPATTSPALLGAVPALPPAPATALIPPGPPPLPGLTGMPAIPGAAAAAPVAAGAAAPAAAAPDGITAIICVDNMFTEGVMKDDEEYVEVMQDLQEECGKSGNVVDIKVPRPSDPSMVGQGNFGKAFVQFSTPQQALAVKELLHGRSFDGQVLNVTFLPSMPAA